MSNADLEKTLNTTDEWIVERTGIRQRHIAAKDECTSTLGCRAAEMALRDANCPASEVDLIIVATTTPDYTFPSVAAGYWENDAATEATFRAKIVGEGETHYLRTGDLGFVHSGDGQLYICGRLKDVIICDGCNFHPEDIEYSIVESVPVLKHQSCAVFGYYDEAQRQRIASTIEVDRSFKRRPSAEFKEIKTQVRQAVAEKHGIALSDVVFIPPNSLRKTTSGKIQRGFMRQLFLSGQLEMLES